MSDRKEKTDDTENIQKEGGGESQECEWITKTISYHVLAEVPKIWRMEGWVAPAADMITCGCEIPNWT